MTPAGLPHSDISGSKRACRSPKLFAACHVLHRLSVPRHPPSTLSNLTIKCLDLMRSAVESYGFTLHFFNYNPYSIVNELRSRRPTLNSNLSMDSRSPFVSRLRSSCLLRVRHNQDTGLAISDQPWTLVEQLVELDGIEPTTPCLQSRCSPN